MLGAVLFPTSLCGAGACSGSNHGLGDAQCVGVAAVEQRDLVRHWSEDNDRVDASFCADASTEAIEKIRQTRDYEHGLRIAVHGCSLGHDLGRS